MENKIFKGMPGLVLLPSHMYNLKTVVEDCWFSVPFSGKFSELYPDFFEEAGKDESNDEFKVVFDKNGAKHIASVDLVEALFANSKYPALKDNQVFAITSISLSDSKKTLYAKGSVLEFCIETDRR